MDVDQTKLALKLLRRVKNGDRFAFSRFYDLFSPLVFSFSLRILKSRSDAEDVLQEVFVYIWHHAPAYDASRGTPIAWVSNLTKSRAIDKLRQLRRRDRGMQSFWATQDLAEEEAAQKQSSSLDARLIASGSMTRLSEDQRRPLEMVYFDGMTQEEISERLGIPLGTVKTRIRAGIAHLKELLKKENKGQG